MNLTAADMTPVRLLAQRLHRLDIETARGRTLTAPAAHARRYWDIRRAAARRELLRAIEATRA